MRRIIMIAVSFGVLSASLLVASCSNLISSSISPEQSATQATSTSQPQDIETTVSREQAIAIAAQYFPPAVILESQITVQLWPDVGTYHINEWLISFDNFTTTRAELITLGWPSTSLPEFDEYHVANINIDAETGEVILKAVSDIRLQIIPVSTTPRTTASAFSPQSHLPIEAISASNAQPSGQPVNPGGPVIQITLENISDEPVMALTASLVAASNIPWGPYEFTFGVTPSNPLMPGETISATRILIGGGYNTSYYYPLIIDVTLQSGVRFTYIQRIQIK